MTTRINEQKFKLDFKDMFFLFKRHLHWQFVFAKMPAAATAAELALASLGDMTFNRNTICVAVPKEDKASKTTVAVTGILEANFANVNVTLYSLQRFFKILFSRLNLF